MTRRVSTTGGLIVALAALGAAGCEHTSTAIDAPPDRGPSLVTAAAITGMRGAGAIGSGEPTPSGVRTQSFDLEAGVSPGGVYGRLYYIDSALVKEDGNHPHLVVGPEWPGTFVATFNQTSGTCVAFDGMGRLLNTGELLAFQVDACDNGEPGVGLDVFGILVPQRLVTHGGVYKEGPAPLSRGELTQSSAFAP